MTLLEDPRFDDLDQADDDRRADARRYALDDVPQPGPWRRGARCRNAPWTVFFPERGDDTSLAKQICAGCGVIDECRRYAMAAGPQLRGVWGGLTERERRRLRGAA